jgi:putative membrane protein
MAFLSKTEKERIAAAIRQAELKSSGELVTVIAGSADTYRYIQLLWPALIALALPMILLSFAPALPVTWVVVAQLGLFLFLQLVLLIPSVKMLAIPRSVKRRRAGRLAREQFFEHGLHLTRGRTGVLIFVSVAEHYVEIIADEGINSHIPEGTWDSVVADFVSDVRADRITDGFLVAIKAVGDQLAEHFPRSDEVVDELPNRLIEI